jgi:glycosyltransferase involved in cell wall biosynthesis
MPENTLQLLILGGSSHHPGGVEAFCDRSALALRNRGGWSITRLPTNTAYLTIRHVGRLVKGLRALFKARHMRPDVIWLQYGNLPDLIYLPVARLLGVRVMVTPHLGSNWRSQSNPMLRALSGRLLRMADRLALISWTQEQEINLDPGVPRSLIRNFLPKDVLTVELADPEQQPHALQLIHSGRLSEGKGTFLVVEVCARLRDAGVPFRARITGNASPEDFARLDSLIATHRLGDSVTVLGRVPEAELLDHLRRSDVLIHLSRIDSYPLIVLEAIACSTLPLCMELAGARDQVETYGGHVVSQDAAVAEAADWLAAQDVATLRRLGGSAAVRVRADYSWERCAGALDAALRACAAGEQGTVMQLDPAG